MHSSGYGSAKRIGLTDGARRALVALEFPYSEGGETLLCTKYEEKVLYKKTCTRMRTVGIFRQFPEKRVQTKEG